MPDRENEFEVIEFSMVNKRIFVPLSGVGSFTVQTLLYPLVLLRIRLQLQEGVQVYRGLIHATSSIIREEGFKGLYSGYFIKSAQIISGIFYASTYETVRDAASVFHSLGPSGRSFLGGAAASLVAQSMVVPIDIISQHLMVLSRSGAIQPGTASHKTIPPPPTHVDQIRALTPLRLHPDELSSSWTRFCSVTAHIAKLHGLRGFYNGYVISLCTFVPSSALWWGFYDKFCRLIATLPSEPFFNGPLRLLFQLLPTQPADPSNDCNQLGNRLPRLAIQLFSAPLAGIAAATIVNPIDCVRVRMQVSHVRFLESVRTLWATEGLRWFTKGLSARLIQTGIFSFWLVMIYEPVKMFCLKDEFRDRFRASSSSW